MNPVNRNSLLLISTLVVLLVSTMCHGQTLPASLNSSIELVRAGVQADRVTIITAAMNFNDKEGAAFWPLYRKYAYERSTLDDRRVAVIKEYAARYPALTDSEAKDMALRMFECEANLAALKKKYYKKFNAILPAFKVTKFFQVEHRIDLMLDMRVESSLPPLDQPQNDAEK